MKKLTPAPKLVERTIGRGFTARTYREYVPADDSPQAHEAALWAIFSDQAKDKSPYNFLGVKDWWVKLAQKILNAHNLPGRLLVTYRQDEPAVWTYDQPEFGSEAAKGWAGARIEHYVLRVRGIDHDSKDGVGFAARIIEAAAESERPEMDRAMLGAFRLGSLTAELRSYWFSADKGAKKGPRKRTATGRDKAMQRLINIAKQKPTPTTESAWSKWKKCADSTDKTSTGNEVLLFDNSGDDFAAWRISRGGFDRVWREAKDSI
jgi:hypothetical protein